MIATHNIKVNGRWIQAGESYEEQKEAAVQKDPAPEVPEAKAEETPAEEPKAEAKPRTTTRRKTTVK